MIGLPCKDALPAYPPMPDPTPEDIEDPVFLAIWNVMKSWDVNVPEHYFGYMGATGSHVKLIMDAIQEVVGMQAVRICTSQRGFSAASHFAFRALASTYSATPTQETL